MNEARNTWSIEHRLLRVACDVRAPFVRAECRGRSAPAGRASWPASTPSCPYGLSALPT